MKYLKPKYIIPAILIISVGLNLYYFVFQKWVKEQRQESFTQGVVYVFQQAVNNGQVSYTDQEGNRVILILSR